MVPWVTFSNSFFNNHHNSIYQHVIAYRSTEFLDYKIIILLDIFLQEFYKTIFTMLPYI